MALGTYIVQALGAVAIEIPIEDNPNQHLQIGGKRAARIKHEPAPQKGNNVAPGHEGSRRRRRYEMQHLLGCQQRVLPSAEDWIIAPVHQHRTIAWNEAAGVDPFSLRSSLDDRHKPLRDSTTLPRAIRRELKKTHVSSTFVHSIEKEMRDIINPAGAEKDYDVVEDDELPQASHPHKRRSVTIAIDAPSEKAKSYSRYWVHMISKYYKMKSFSRDWGDQRVACIEFDNKKSLPAVWFSDLV